MFVHDLSPILIQLGPLAIRYYSLAYIAGALLLYLFVLRSRKTLSMTTKQVDTLLTYLIIGVIVGGRLGFVLFYHPYLLWRDPLEIIMIWHGGMAFHGGIIGVALAGWLFCRRHNVNFWKLADVAVVPVALGLFLGRLANFINGEIVGVVTDVPWCVVFPDVDHLCRHPSQLYEATKNLLIAGILVVMGRFNTQTGTRFWTFVGLYGLLRFVVTFLRDDPSVLWALSMGQVLSFCMLVLAIVMLFVIKKTSPTKGHVQHKKR